MCRVPEKRKGLVCLRNRNRVENSKCRRMVTWEHSEGVGPCRGRVLSWQVIT